MTESTYSSGSERVELKSVMEMIHSVIVQILLRYISYL